MIDRLERAAGGRDRGFAANHDQLERDLASRVEPQQTVDLAVHESRQHARGEAEAAGDGEEVGEHRPGVPEEVAVGARLVLPSVAPVDSGEQDGRGAARDRVVARRRRERVANITGAQAAKGKVAGREVIEASVEPGDLTNRHVHLGLVERARRSRSAEENLSPTRVRLPLGHAGGVVEDRRELAQHECRATRRRAGDGGERFGRRGIELARQSERRDLRIDLERERLDVPLERVTAGAHRRGRVRGPVVVLAGGQKRYGGRTTPRSVMIAAMSRAGVTSKAGLNTGEAPGAVCCAPTRRTSDASRSSIGIRSEEHTSELQSPCNLVCRLLLEKKKKTSMSRTPTLTHAPIS